MKQFLLPEGGSFYKVNMHSHTKLSDGRQTPEEIKSFYTAQGYSVVAFTEHEGLFDLSYLSDENFIAITSYEYAFGDNSNPPFAFYSGKPHTFDHTEQLHLNLYAKDPHNTNMVCFNPKYLWGHAKEVQDSLHHIGGEDFVRSFTTECFNEVIRTARENGFLVIYNHPTWSLNTYPVYSRLVGLTGIEIVNGASDLGSDMDYTPYVYDQMARAGQRLICVGGDDNHGTAHFFRAWTMVKADELSYDALIRGIECGNTYASSGPEIRELFVENGAVTIRCSDAAGVFLSTAGRRKACKRAENGAPPITEATFALKPDDIFFRLSVRDSAGHHADTRIYYTDELKD